LVIVALIPFHDQNKFSTDDTMIFILYIYSNITKEEELE
jgi:hypothetical protein